MRTPIRRVATLVASIALAACSSGTVIVLRQPVPPPPPPSPRIEPLEITVARPVRGHLIVQTNRPSYVALFEIVPNRGVALLAPAHAHQRTWMLAGLNWVPVSWKVQSTMYYGPPATTAVPARWVYAIASDEPLRLPDEAFHPGYLRRVLGLAAYRGTNPYVTMRAIARAFVPSVVDEAWAEDAYTLPATYASDPYRSVRIFCANRTMYEVPEELADRVWCPVRVASGGTAARPLPTRPDSIVASNGQRLRRRFPEPMPVRTPIDRVQEPTRQEKAPLANDNNGPRNDGNRDVRDAKDVKDAGKERRGNGNAYGHTDDPGIKGRGIEGEKREDPRREPRVDQPHTKGPLSTPDKTEIKQDKQEEKHDEKQARREERQDEKQLRQDERQEEKQSRQEDKQEEKQARQDERQDEKQTRREEKQEEKPRSVETPRETLPPAIKPDEKVESKPDKPDVKPDTKEEKAETKAEVKAESKPESKAEEKGNGKPEDKGEGKPDSEPPGKKGKGKP